MFEMNTLKVSEPQKKKITFLLGAGAALPWGGPKTDHLTDLIIEDKKFKVKNCNKEPLGSYLYKRLCDFYKNNEDAINFETILSLLESLIEYYTAESSTNPNPLNHSIWPSITTVDDSFVKDVFNYKLAYSSDNNDPEDIQYWYIPGDSENGPIPYTKNQIKSKFLIEVFKHFTNIIIQEILKYSNTPAVESKKAESEALKDFINILTVKGFLFRFYSTNFDRLIPMILEESTDVFEGFTAYHDNTLRIDIGKIHSDKNSLVHYNIHGSVHWESLYNGLFPDYQLLKNTLPYNPFHENHQVEIGKRVIITNIIAGQDKTQKMFIPPFKYFEHAFLDDCFSSDFIMIIGNSLSDFNIQKVLSLALSIGNKKLVIIDHDPNQNISKVQNALRKIDPKDKYSTYDTDKNGDWYCNGNKNCFVYLNGFKEFLVSNAWEKTDIHFLI